MCGCDSVRAGWGSVISNVLFFFFQAEDGIRDVAVTGVQTCALPISSPPLPDWFHGTKQHHLDSSSPLKETFYGKPDGQARTSDRFESLIDPHAPAWKIGRASCRERV